MNRYYIAYGSNLNINQMKMRCPMSKPVGTAIIKNYELLFKGSKTGSYLTIEKKDGASVPVAIWAVSPEDESFLDFYEGYPEFYYKKEFKLPVKSLETDSINTYIAFAYIMHEERLIGVPSAEYMQTCHDGYADFGFDHTILTNAYLKCGGTDIL